LIKQILVMTFADIDLMYIETTQEILLAFHEDDFIQLMGHYHEEISSYSEKYSLDGICFR